MYNTIVQLQTVVYIIFVYLESRYLYRNIKVFGYNSIIINCSKKINKCFNRILFLSILNRILFLILLRVQVATDPVVKKIVY